MSRLAIFLWIANVCLDTGGRMAFKSAAASRAGGGTAGAAHWREMLRSAPLWLGVICFALEFVAWLALLALIPLSQAVLIGSINIVSVALAGRVMFGERITRLRVTGIVLIAAGVALAGGMG